MSLRPSRPSASWASCPGGLRPGCRAGRRARHRARRRDRPVDPLTGLPRGRGGRGPAEHRRAAGRQDAPRPLPGRRCRHRVRDAFQQLAAAAGLPENCVDGVATPSADRQRPHRPAPRARGLLADRPGFCRGVPLDGGLRDLLDQFAAGLAALFEFEEYARAGARGIPDERCRGRAPPRSRAGAPRRTVLTPGSSLPGAASPRAGPSESDIDREAALELPCSRGPARVRACPPRLRARGAAEEPAPTRHAGRRRDARAARPAPRCRSRWPSRSPTPATRRPEPARRRPTTSPCR